MIAKRGGLIYPNITAASGDTSVEAHQVAIQRMIAAGANMVTWLALAAEWQRDWARTEHAGELTEVLKQHAQGVGWRMWGSSSC